MKIIKTELPKGSVLSKEMESYDYADSFQGNLNTSGSITTAEIGRAFFSSSPQWGKKMFALRNTIVKIFGLKTGADHKKMQIPDDFNPEVGEQVGIFRIFDRTSNEIILGEDDQHLDFRVSLLYDQFQDETGVNSLTISTTVKYHNWLGVLYFLPVRPFHRLIVPVMLKKMIRKLETKSEQ